MFFFQLGSHPTLSLDEIGAVLPESKLTTAQKNIALTESVAPFSASILQERLAGVIKIGQIIGSFEAFDQEAITTFITDQITSTADGTKQRFGISIHGSGSKQDRDQLGLIIKKQIKAQNISCRFVSAKEKTLSAVIVTTNKLIESAGEFILIESAGTWLVGQTLAVQDFKAWSHRDFGRPARDAKNGMLPPKLARMMINLSGADATQTLMDPFCGSGTVLMEASLMGFHTLYGNDIAEKAIDDTHENMQWVTDQFDRDPDVTLIHGGAQDLPGELDNQIDVVVTETTLGPPQKGNESDKQLEQIVSELIPVFADSLKRLHSVIKKDGSLVIAFPEYRGFPLPLEELVSEAGFTISSEWHYKRSNQHVGRHILRLITT